MSFPSPTIRSSPVAAVILAGGYSSRMGEFKALLPFGCGTVLECVVSTLRAAGVARIVVVSGYRAEETEAEAGRLGIDAARNPQFATGMSSSVRVGITAVPEAAPGCLLLPVDMPLLRSTTVRRVLSASGGEADLVQPVFQGQPGHPPFIARRLFASILASPSWHPLDAVLAREVTRAVEVSVFDRYCLEDMDDPTSYVRFLAQLGRHHCPDEMECESMLAAAGASELVCRHGQVVARIAGALTGRLRARGLDLDVDLVRSAALLHDIAKGHPHHADVGASLVADWGFPEVARVISGHMELPAIWNLDERAVVFLADKLVCGENTVSIKERFAPALVRWRDDPVALEGVHARRAAAEAVLRAVGEDLDAACVEDVP